MTNNEIIEEELKTFIKDYWTEDRDNEIANDNDIEWFATKLLSKLNRLDRKNVREIISSYIISNRLKADCENIIDQILTLISEEAKLSDNDFEVIARGKVEHEEDIDSYGILDANGFLTYYDELISMGTLRQLEGKNIEIAIKVIPDIKDESRGK